MPAFTVTVGTTKYVAGVRDLETKQLPFVMAKTLTDTAKDGQAEVKRNVRAAFKLRNTWTEMGIRIKPADKKGSGGRIEADVHTDTANRRTGAPDYLGRQEEGGEKVPYGGHQYIAVPTKYLRRYAPRIIPPALRPKNLLPEDAKLGKGYKGSLSTVGTKRWEKVGKRGLRALGSSEFVAFLQVSHRGTLCIFVRAGSRRDAEPFYVLIPHARVKRSGLEMEKTVERVVNDRFGRHWDENWRGIYASGLRI